jgi:hypothetical protein
MRKIRVTEFFSRKVLSVTQVATLEEGGIEITGEILDDKYGVYALKLVNQDNLKKETMGIGPQHIRFDKQIKEFTAKFEIEDILYADEPKLCELYARNKPQSIPYSQAHGKFDYGHLELVQRIPMELIPDPRVMIEDAVDREKEDREEMKRQEV